MTIFKAFLLNHQKSLYMKCLQMNFVSTTSKIGAILSVDPPSCMQDEPVHITCSSLKPGENITLTNSTIDDRGKKYFSISHFRADKNGCIDLNSSSSLGGHFEGIFPMGPFITIESTGPGAKGVGFNKKDEKPLLCNLKVLSGHLEGEAAYEPETQSVIAEKSHERLYLAPGVKQIKVNSGRVRGKLFLPPGDGPFPGVIDLYGTSGGLNPSRASLLASRGIAAFSLAIFRYEDLTPAPVEIDLTYFEEAVQYLLSHPKVKKPHVGVIGLSKGADIALAMGTYIEEVKSVIAVNGFAANTWWPLRVGDKVIPALPQDMSQVEFTEDNVAITINALSSSEDHPECCLPLEESDASFLFIVGEADLNWKSEEETLRGIERLKANGKQNWKYLCYSGAGHFINPPYSSLVKIGYHSFIKLFFTFGGSAKEHSEAQVHSWKETLHFFKSNLSSKL